MISLSISRDSLTPPLTPLSIADAGTGTYVLMSFNPGQRLRDNAIAESRWIDGGSLTSSKVGLLTMQMTLMIRAASLSALETAAADLDEALGQFSYTITQTTAGALTTTTYTCMPASTSLDYDPALLRNSMGLFTATIPVQP